MFLANIYTGILCLYFLLTKAFCKVNQSCTPNAVVENASCLNTEVCEVEAKTCQCKYGYTVVGDECAIQQTTPSYSSLVDNQGDGSLVAGILIPLSLVAFVICSIYVSKRFELVKWLRERLHQRNRNYDEFMIGRDDDDDPPLA